MQSRRREEFLDGSGSNKVRSHRYEVGRDRYPIPQHNMVDRFPGGPRRSLSPYRNGELQRELDGRGSRPGERWEYGWHNFDGGRVERLRSRSPPRGRISKRDYDEQVVSRGQECYGSVDFGAGSKARVKDDYAHGDDRIRYGISKEKDYRDGSISAVNGRGLLIREPLAMDEVSERGSYKLHSNLGPTSSYRGAAGCRAPLSLVVADAGQFEDKSIQHPNSGGLDKLSVIEPYTAERKPILRPKDISYNVVATAHPKDHPSSHSRTMQREEQGSYRHGVPLPSDEYVKSVVKPLETADQHIDECAKRQLRNIARDFGTSKNMACYQQGAYSPATAEHWDGYYCKQQTIVNEFHGHPPDDIHRMNPPTSRLGYDQTRMEYDHRDPLKLGIMHPQANDYFEDTKRNNALDHPSSGLYISNYPDLNRTCASGHHVECMNRGCTHAEYGRSVSHDPELPLIDGSQNNQIANLRLDHHYGRNAVHKGRTLEMSPVARYSSEFDRLDDRAHEVDEYILHESLDRMPMRQYGMEENINTHLPRNAISSELNEPTEFKKPCDEEVWNEEDGNHLYSHEPALYGYTRDCRVNELSYDEEDCHEDLTSDDWSSSHYFVEHPQGHSPRFYKHDTKSRTLGSHRSYQFSRKGKYQKHQSVWKQKDGYHKDEVHDGYPLEDPGNTSRSDLYEESEEFKQQVHEAFLAYSKRLNATPHTRKKYTENGRAGTLFCIVCKRSQSKEFMDTRGLAAHAFMSHKIGLRAEHLGLHKAICVLMGWDINAPPNTVTWAPQLLSNAKAMAQKEDLILWPPLVIIYNLSLFSKNPKEWKLISPEMLETFLRGKGFIDGKIKVCRGNPADGSVMLVKFLGTFTGLGNTERIHQYFADKKRGRTDFERIASKNVKVSNSAGPRLQTDLVEPLLYGHMGISEDFDRLDYNSKKIIVVKSKKEIQDLANAPVKAEEM